MVNKKLNIGFGEYNRCFLPWWNKNPYIIPKKNIKTDVKIIFVDI